jgi:cysteinyl-tRNA synthetase
MIALTNTLTGKKEPFVSLKEMAVSLYVCGITPYDYAHIGHGRVYVTFDILLRILRLSGYDVTYCRNFTDIDDKLLHRAEKEFGDKFRYVEIAQRYIDAYHEDVAALGCYEPNSEPRVTETVPQIISFIEGLIKNGYAYQVDGDVYYRVMKFPSYGKLSKRKTEDLLVGARVELNEKKENPLDFALWKGEQEGTFWKSPWGYGRPGWHIECSAMAADHLAPHIDIHGGGMDLIFPHHENEIAQSEGLYGGTFSTYWLHNAFVRINEEKMSKSLGNFFTLKDVFESFDPMVVRFYYLQHHYRSPLDFSFQDLQSAEKAYRRLCKAFSGSECPVQMTYEYGKVSPLFQKIVDFVSDDLNTVGALGVVFEHLSDMKDELCSIKFFLQQILGLSLELLPEKQVEITEEIRTLLQEREAARAAKEWAKADALRDQLFKLGYEVQDKKL